MEFLQPEERPPMVINVQLERTRFGTVRAAFNAILDTIQAVMDAHPDFSVAQMLAITQEYAGMVHVNVLDPQALHFIDMNWMK